MVFREILSVLGVSPMLGRGIAPTDDRPGAPAVAMLAYAFWMRRYSGDPAIVGKTIWLDAKSYSVIGVLPESFFSAPRSAATRCSSGRPLPTKRRAG